MRGMEKSSCGQCGKQFTNKKGVKQHILRMHVVKRLQPNPVKSSNDIICLEKVSVVINENLENEQSTTINSEMLDTAGKDLSIFPNESRSEHEKGLEKITIFRDILMECVENALLFEDEAIETNYQCGECGQLFQSQEEIDNHIENEHKENDYHN